MAMFWMGLWNSPEGLICAFRWISFGGLAVIALLGIAGYAVNDRIGTLQSQKLSEQTDRLQALSSTLAKLQADQLAPQQEPAKPSQTQAETYDYNGAHWATSDGQASLNAGQETDAFERMEALGHDRNWTALEALSETEIAKSPAWLTPYLFSGIAATNLANLDKGIARLSHVVAVAGDDPIYAQARSLLSEVKRAKAAQG